MSGFLAELLEKEVKKGVEEGIQKGLQKELQKELQKNSTEIAISKICKMIELGYSKEDVLKLDYTNVEYALALDRLSKNKQEFAGVSRQTKSENQIIYICDLILGLLFLGCPGKLAERFGEEVRRNRSNPGS